MFILIKIKKNNLSTNRDYFFHSKKIFKKFDLKNFFFNYITNANIVVVQIRNILNRFCILLKNVKVDMFRDFKKKMLFNVIEKSLSNNFKFKKLN